MSETNSSTTKTYKDLKELIETGPLGDGLRVNVSLEFPPPYFLAPTSVWFYCASDTCGRRMEFFLDAKGERHGKILLDRAHRTIAINYVCRNCDNVHSIHLYMGEDKSPGPHRWTVKVGEWPPQGPPLSKALLKISGTGGGLLKKGYRAELQGLGVGAFAYYRRVLEIMKADLFQQIRTLADAYNSTKSVKERLDTAIATRSFENSLDRMGKALPPELLIDGKNPLKLLHSMVSAGLHSMSDQECLARAELTRETLEHLVERLDQLSKHPEKLRVALGKVEKATNAPKPDGRQPIDGHIAN